MADTLAEEFEAALDALDITARRHQNGEAKCDELRKAHAALRSIFNRGRNLLAQPLVAPRPLPYIPYTPSPSPTTMYRCNSCGGYYSSGSAHVCYGGSVAR